jgi:uncharacterized LabA/DUF88 family protein
MRIRRIAILIDGGFFIKRLSNLVGKERCDSPATVADWSYMMCKRHVQKLTGEPFSVRRSRWLDHVYRIFYYDATPYGGVAHHPITNSQIQFAKTSEAQFRRDLFEELRRKRKFALRLGHVIEEDGWHFKNAGITKKLLRTRNWLRVLDAAVAQAAGGPAPDPISPAEAAQLQRIADAWRAVSPDDLKLGLRQKGVDMRIGIDIASLTLKKQVDTIILVTGDSDFVPAAKLARREGVEFLLDPLWQSVNDDLHEHVDGMASGLPRPGEPVIAAADENDFAEYSAPPSPATPSPQVPENSDEP